MTSAPIPANEAAQLAALFRASHDALTGLANRTVLQAALKQAWNSARADGAEHALMVIDLDHFKLVNDVCGHAAGDRLLQAVATMMREAVRGSDTVARLGGDEFAILLHGCSLDHAQKVAQSLCDRVDQFRFDHEGQAFHVGTSIGLVAVSPRWASTAEVMEAADGACHAAKESGRNRVHLGLGSDAAAALEGGEKGWASRIGEALQSNGFTLYAQRIEALGSTAGAVHAEVLLRMLAGDGSLILPEAFLPAAERFQLGTDIDQWVLQAAIRWVQAHPALSTLACLSINLSRQSIGDPGFHRWAVDTLSAAGAPICRRLGLEITEAAVIAQLDEASAFVGRLRALGVRVALNDVGTSSFGYLKTLTVDVLKIDGQFSTRLLTEPLDAAAVRSCIDVAQVLGIQTVAKSVEGSEILARVRAMGVDYAQGFGVHAPAPIDELLSVRSASAPASAALACAAAVAAR